MRKNICLTFHGFYRPDQAHLLEVNKEIFIKTEYVDQLFERLQSEGYTFKLPEDIKNDDEKACSITIDDGYYNNFNFLETAEKYKAPFTLFVCSYNVEKQAPYIWDVQEYEKQNWSFSTDSYIDFYKEHSFKNHSLMKNDLYRPMKSEELHEFVKSPYAHLGVHTHTHQPLVHTDILKLNNELSENIEYLRNFSSFREKDLSLPCGLFSQTIKKQLKSQFDRIYTIDGGKFAANKKWLNRITLANPEITFGLWDQIEKSFSLRYKLGRLKARIKNTYYQPIKSKFL